MGPQPAQPVGVSAAFLVDVQPQTDGSEGLKYNLTADIIDSVFRTYPAGTWVWPSRGPQFLSLCGVEKIC